MSGVVQFVRWAAQMKVTSKNISHRHVESFIRLLVESPSARSSGVKNCCFRFFAILESNTGRQLFQRPGRKVGHRIRAHVDLHVEYLYKVRGLSPHSVSGMRVTVESFLTWRFKKRAVVPGRITPESVVEFMRWRGKSCSPRTLQGTSAALKTYLRYLFANGLTKSDLSIFLPKIAAWRNQRHIHALSKEEVLRLLQISDQSTRRGAREYAMLLLMCQYGLRAIEISRLKLPDILWSQRKILIQGKSSRFSEIPLTDEVSAALKRYIEHVRPSMGHQHIFLTSKPPYRPMDKLASISSIVNRALERAGIKSPIGGARLLRYTAASGILNNGGTLRQVGELLRQKSMNTSSRYVRIDFHRLSMAALPWPRFARGLAK